MEKQSEVKRTFWKSLDEKYQTPEFIEAAEKEFASSPLKEEDDKSGLARRQFMKLMGASIALSSAACVRRPVQKIIPYNKRPSEVVIGIPNYYASSLFDGAEGFATTVKTREGRPLFLAGNSMYPGNGQGLSVRASSQILALYDPDRVRTPIDNSQNVKYDDNGKVVSRKRGKMISVPRDWDSLDKKAVKQLKKGGVAILTGDMPSPSLQGMMTKFSQATGAKVYKWTSINQGDIREAAQKSFGVSAVPKYRYDKANVIVSVDGDFLGTHLNPTESTRLFSQNRDPEKKMSRLVSFQSVPSLTSYNADDNYSIRASHQLPLVLNIIHELATAHGAAVPASAKALASGHSKAFSDTGMSQEDFSSLVKSLWDNRGASIVVAGGLQTKTQDSVSLQIAVNLLNSLLDNNGSTIYFSNGLNTAEGTDQGLMDLMVAIEAGDVTTLIIDQLNPVFQLPESSGFASALNKVDMVITTNNWMDETASMADLVAPAGHSMENWGDFEFEPGLVAIQQPTVQPLHNTRSLADTLMKWSKDLGQPISDKETFFDEFKAQWTQKVGGEQAWYDLLQKGFVGETFDGMERSLGFNPSAADSIKVTLEASPMELSLYPKVGLYDGSMSNVSWLQELPDPVSKIVWDNYLVIAPKTAEELGLDAQSMVEVSTDEFTTQLPVYIAPGQNPYAVAVAVGYGRSAGGEVQNGIGFNVQNFIKKSGSSMVYAGLPVKVKKIAKTYQLASTQGHHTMMGREIAVETTEKQYKKTHEVGLHKHHFQMKSMWRQDHKYEGHKWGLAVDLNSCTGCSACMVACQSENNVPVVGKKYILGGREMHWIRIDRYFSGDENKSVDTIFQPVMCQHCENAPCETVCPVLATVHSDEGLNDMVYNRCVGTRYCSNNCPYKVRRFNWFYYDSHHKREPLQMALNPDVTVRTRGVMEKCTFCVQRIKAAKNVAKDEKRPLKDGDIKTACQEVCPSNSIVFGDLNDENSEVARLFKNHRKYTLLEEFNAAPRVRYLAKIRNTDRDLGGHHGDHHGDAHSDSHGSKEHHKEGH